MQVTQTLTPASTIIVFLLYSSFSFFYNSCFTFYDAFLLELTMDGRSMERTSGFAMGMGQVGNVVGLLVALPLAKGNISILGFSGKPLIFVVGGVLFLLFSLPVFLFLKDKPDATDSVKLGRSLRETLHDLRHIREHPGVPWYLVTYCLFADALLTLQLFASFYLDTVGKLSDTEKNIAFLVAVLFGIAGSFTSPLLVRLFGSRKRAITACIALWAIVLGALAFATNQALFMGLIVLNGFAFGALFSLSRAFFAHLVPSDKQAEMFGLYALFERTASVFGPLLWSGTALAFVSFGDDRYRFSIASLAVLVLISLIAIQKVKEPAIENDRSSK